MMARARKRQRQFNRGEGKLRWIKTRIKENWHNWWKFFKVMRIMRKLSWINGCKKTGVNLRRKF